MANRHSVFVYFYLASLWFLLGGAASLKQTGPKFVYRPDTRTPEQIKKAGGFLADDRSPDADFSIFNHVNAPNNWDAYVSLTTSSLANKVSANQKDASVLYIYKVKTTPNIYDVDKTLGEYNPQTSRGNFAALGGVKWDQIVSWRMGNAAGWLGSTKNVDYNKKHYKGLKGGGAQPSLAGFPADSEAWNKEPWAQFKPRDHIGKKDGKDAEGDDEDELVNPFANDKEDTREKGGREDDKDKYLNNPFADDEEDTRKKDGKDAEGDDEDELVNPFANDKEDTREKGGKEDDKDKYLNNPFADDEEDTRKKDGKDAEGDDEDELVNPFANEKEDTREKGGKEDDKDEYLDPIFDDEDDFVNPFGKDEEDTREKGSKEDDKDEYLDPIFDDEDDFVNPFGKDEEDTRKKGGNGAKGDDEDDFVNPFANGRRGN